MAGCRVSAHRPDFAAIVLAIIILSYRVDPTKLHRSTNVVAIIVTKYSRSVSEVCCSQFIVLLTHSLPRDSYCVKSIFKWYGHVLQSNV